MDEQIEAAWNEVKQAFKELGVTLVEASLVWVILTFILSLFFPGVALLKLWFAVLTLNATRNSLGIGLSKLKLKILSRGSK